ncbi:MAG: UDP-3-O-(3-hydroxymyristoyl)glucosamine N-acyltransferase [Bacteroidetes bacterium CG12_big_fil_rev_8_21_14_0_65_60_17]|nr:MAG: UDP-3-O-(3-hydroxymyristoyl)glucosamine N-acyltransferase [Bacteroidetes bacterium CG12_big_fil_rev_8_21_14_0_65_60_17]
MTSDIHPSAQIGNGTTCGHGCVVEAGVTVGRKCQIGHHVVIREGSIIGDNVRIDDGATIGKQPMRAAASAVTSDQKAAPCRIGDGAIVGTHAVIYAGSTLAERVLVADLATIRENVSIGEQTIVGRGVAVENFCTIGRRCKIETEAYITAHSELEDFVFVAPGVLTSNDAFAGRTEERFKHFKGVTVRRGARLGVGSIILPGLEIGADAMIAAGALLTRDAEPGMVYMGSPARPIRRVPPEQLLDAQNWQ